MAKGLGKGLGALLPDDRMDEAVRGAVVDLRINDISPNSEQPRRIFDKERLEELAESIKANGVIQPVIVRKEGAGYRLVAGERRWRAARLAGIATLPAIVRELTDLEVLEYALIENIQRQDLNPIEEAQAFEKLIKEHGLTQEKLAGTVGRSRPAIANALRLLNLSEEVRRFVETEELSAGHARALLSLTHADAQKKAALLIIQKDLSVRDTERLVKTLLTVRKSKRKPDAAYESSLRDVESRFSSALATKVHLNDRNRKGTIVIEYYSLDDLQRILDIVAKPR
jgi:ParB family transcriptional regulator, chromosome partitioning protein